MNQKPGMFQSDDDGIYFLLALVFVMGIMLGAVGSFLL